MRYTIYISIQNLQIKEFHYFSLFRNFHMTIRNILGNIFNPQVSRVNSHMYRPANYMPFHQIKCCSSFEMICLST